MCAPGGGLRSSRLRCPARLGRSLRDARAFPLLTKYRPRDVGRVPCRTMLRWRMVLGLGRAAAAWGRRVRVHVLVCMTAAVTVPMCVFMWARACLPVAIPRPNQLVVKQEYYKTSGGAIFGLWFLGAFLTVAIGGGAYYLTKRRWVLSPCVFTVCFAANVHPARSCAYLFTCACACLWALACACA
jgi:hypothetical protein